MTSNALKASYKYQIKRLVFVPLLIVGYEILILVFSALLISYFDMDKSFISLALPEIASFGASLYSSDIYSYYDSGVLGDYRIQAFQKEKYRIFLLTVGCSFCDSHGHLHCFAR